MFRMDLVPGPWRFPFLFTLNSILKAVKGLPRTATLAAAKEVRLANPWTVVAENIHDSKRDGLAWA
jgi:hypothetical protein